MMLIDTSDKEVSFFDFDDAKEWLRSQCGENDELKKSDDLFELLAGFQFELFGFDNDEARIFALAKYLDCDVGEISEVKYSDRVLTYGRQQYLVVTDEEAEEEWHKSLNGYIDSEILPQLPEPYHQYFARETYKEDARSDGRAWILASYDGEEDSIAVDGIEFYIYRQH